MNSPISPLVDLSATASPLDVRVHVSAPVSVPVSVPVSGGGAKVADGSPPNQTQLLEPAARPLAVSYRK